MIPPSPVRARVRAVREEAKDLVAGSGLRAAQQCRSVRAHRCPLHRVPAWRLASRSSTDLPHRLATRVARRPLRCLSRPSTSGGRDRFPPAIGRGGIAVPVAHVTMRPLFGAFLSRHFQTSPSCLPQQGAERPRSRMCGKVRGVDGYIAVDGRIREREETVRWASSRC